MPGLLMLTFVPFPFNWFPQRVGRKKLRYRPAVTTLVSIQLVSPASGEIEMIFHAPVMGSLFLGSFHSIGFPSEWGADRSPKAFRRSASES